MRRVGGGHEKESVKTRVNSVLYRTHERKEDGGNNVSMVCPHSFVVQNRIESSSRLVIYCIVLLERERETFVLLTHPHREENETRRLLNYSM